VDKPVGRLWITQTAVLVTASVTPPTFAGRVPRYRTFEGSSALTWCLAVVTACPTVVTPSGTHRVGRDGSISAPRTALPATQLGVPSARVDAPALRLGATALAALKVDGVTRQK
jgi:hypothetical protein